MGVGGRGRLYMRNNLARLGGISHSTRFVAYVSNLFYFHFVFM